MIFLCISFLWMWYKRVASSGGIIQSSRQTWEFSFQIPPDCSLPNFQKGMSRMYRNIIVAILVVSLAVVHSQNLGDANRYRPIYRFDGASGGYCYPDYPSSSNDGTCRTTLDQRAPVFVRVDACGDDTVYTYWLWYGLQQPTAVHCRTS